MPRSLASLGPCTLTGLPSNSYSPSSKAWMPAMPLIRVLLPAPLSPTSAVTLPGLTSRSTPRSTCTAPKLFWIPRRLSNGVVDAAGVGCSGASTDTGISSSRWMARAWVPLEGDVKGARGPVPVRTDPRAVSLPAASCRPRRRLLDAVLGAGLGDRAGADVCSRRVAVADNRLDLVGRDPHRGGQRGRDVLAGLGVGNRRGRQRAGRVLVAVDQRDRQVGRRLGLQLGVLVDRAALEALQDVLQTLDGRVLTGDRDLTGRAVGLHAGD